MCCSCGITEFCVMCYNTIYRTDEDYNEKLRLIISVCIIHDEETIDYEYKYLCDEHRIKEDECLLMNEIDYKNKTYSIKNKKEMLSLFAIPENMIKLEYCKNIDGDYEDVHITQENYNKIKNMAEHNENILKRE